MRRILSLLCPLVLLFSGCVQEELQTNESAPLDGRIFTASFEQDQTRTYLEDGNLLRWNAGDQISLFDGNTLNRQYQFDGETGDNSGTFSIVNAPYGSGNDLNANYAIYPYASNIKITEAGVITVTVPAEQNYTENSFGLGANTMVAVTENLNDTFLKFKNVSGYLRLQLYGDDVTLKSIALTGNSNEKIAGKASIITTYNDDPQISMLGDATSCITLNCGEGVKIGSTAENITDFWIVIPPTTFEDGFTITITDINDETFIKSTSNEIAIERNVIKPMKAFEVIFENESEDEGSSNDYIDEYGVNHGPGVEIDGVVWAPVNCGYHATDYPYGKLYQWGRKYGQGYLLEYDATVPDEFLQGGAWDDETSANIFFYCPDAVMDDDEAEAYYWQYGKMQDDIRPIDWLDYPNDKLWNSGTLLDPVKTNSDPCPSGWRVPTDIELNNIKITLPKSGMRDDRGEADYRDQRGFYWSSTATSRYTPWWTVSDYMNDVALSNDGPSYRVYGYAVRCVQE